MPKRHIVKKRTKKESLLLGLWHWFIGAHYITKSVIVFAVAVFFTLPYIANQSYNLPTTSHAYGWLGYCGGSGQFVCTVSPRVDQNNWIIYQEAVPSNQCAINGTNAGLRGAQINCCGTKVGSIYGTCNSGGDYCSTDQSTCGPLVPNWAFGNPGDTNSCPQPDTLVSPASQWTFLYHHASDGQNYTSQACAARDGVNAANGMAVTVTYDSAYDQQNHPQQVLLWSNSFGYLQPGKTYKLTFSAKQIPTASWGSITGQVDVSISDNSQTVFQYLNPYIFYVGSNWQTYSTTFTPSQSNTFNHLIFNLGVLSQKVWIDNVNIQVISPYVGDYYATYTDHTACGIQGTKAGYPRGTQIYCACGAANGAAPCQ